LQANDEASLLKDMLIALGFSKPPDGITSFVLFSKVESKVCHTCNTGTISLCACVARSATVTFAHTTVILSLLELID